MAPPFFSDIGKSANDLLGKDFPTGSIKLEAKTTASDGVNFTVAGSKDNKSGSIAGDLKTKYSDKARGLTITETWTTGNVLSTDIELADTLKRGLKINAFGSLLPVAGQKNARVAVQFKQDLFSTRSSIDLFKGPSIHGDITFGRKDVILGAETSYDVASGQFTKYNFAIGYSTAEYAIAVNAFNRCTAFSGSYSHNVSRDLSAGAKATWDKKNGSNVTLEAGAKLNLDSSSFVKAKVDNAGKLGLGYTQILRPGVKLSLGSIIDTTKMNENAHKVGLSLVLES